MCDFSVLNSSQGDDFTRINKMPFKKKKPGIVACACGSSAGKAATAGS